MSTKQWLLFLVLLLFLRCDSMCFNMMLLIIFSPMNCLVFAPFDDIYLFVDAVFLILSFHWCLFLTCVCCCWYITMLVISFLITNSMFAPFLISICLVGSCYWSYASAVFWLLVMLWYYWYSKLWQLLMLSFPTICLLFGLGPAQDVHIFYTLSHLSALQNCALILSTIFLVFFAFKSCITQFSHLIVSCNKIFQKYLTVI